MLHLAQVVKPESDGKTALKLLACQQSDFTWMILEQPPIKTFSPSNPLSEGVLVLAEISDNEELAETQISTDWVLRLVETYLTTNITPAFLQQETERAEKWRQVLTLESQELGRRALEIEARRDKIQLLEESLKKERQELEEIAKQLKKERQELGEIARQLTKAQEQIDSP